MKVKQQNKNGRLIPVMDTELADFPKERWKVIPEFDNYELSNYGRVKAIRSRKILRLRVMRIDKNSKSIIIQMTLCKNKKNYSFSVIRFVYHLFVGPIDLYDRSIVVKKKDGDSYNCFYKNLILKFPAKATKEDFDIPDKKNILWKKIIASNPNANILNTEVVNLPGEKWKFIPGFEDKCQLSNYGRVKSLAREVFYNNGRIVSMPERIRKIRICEIARNPPQYTLTFTLMKSDTRQEFFVPRLVYHLFVAPFDINDSSLIISKKDRDDLNCYYKNLRLKTISEAKTELYSSRGVENVLYNLIKPVNQYDKDGKFLCRYNSIADASKAMKIGVMQIRNAIYRKQLQAKKYYWQTGEQKPEIDLSEYSKKRHEFLQLIQKPVQKLSIGGKVLAIYPSASNAAMEMGYNSKKTIAESCKKNRISGGFKWRYVDTEAKDNARKNTGKSKPVNQYTRQGKFVKTYNSISEAAKVVNITSSAISNAARLKDKMAKEFYWRYGNPMASIDVSKYENKREHFLRSTKREVQRFSLAGALLATYESVLVAANAINAGTWGIRNACKNFDTTCKGFRWKFK